MPHITKRLISDQLLTLLDGGFPDVAASVQKQDIWVAIEQWINAKFKVRHFSETLASGETIPDNAAIATYEGVAVTSIGDKSKCTLPIMPVSLPRTLGVYQITDGKGYSFIPLQRGQIAILGADFMLNTLFGQICYEQNGLTVTFSQDIKLLGMDTVDIDLVVFDMTQYSETDILPIPSDMVNDLVNDLFKMYVPVQPQPSLVNNYPLTQNKQ